MNMKKSSRDEDVRKAQKTSSGAYYPRETQSTTDRYPDEGESTKLPDKPREEALVRCSRCGMERAGWTGNDGQGILAQDQVFCCEGCANNTGCVCTKESARHTGENIGRGREAA
jgi:hypothetical protein